VVQQVTAAARDAGGISVSLSAVAVGADRVFTLLNLKSDVREKPDALELPPGNGEVEFDHVRFGYTREFPVLDDVSFTMRAGEVVAIVGPTGAGKTTIASLIPRFYDVSDGAIRVDGVDIRDCTLKSLRNQIGIVPQDTTLFAGPLRDNIEYGRLGASEEEIVEAAKMANAWEFIERLPKGLDTVIGERGVMLSGGQRQRIAIARAVLRDPRILILDEATSSLDAHSEALIQDAMQKLVTNRTTLVIAHRLSTIRNADKILVLQAGRVIEMGRHQELLNQNGVYASLYRTQFRSHEGEMLEDREEAQFHGRE
jgi:subfamily B ATP-binding cassette protein MsbA